MLTSRSYIAPFQVEHALILYLTHLRSDRQALARFCIRHSHFEACLQDYVRDSTECGILSKANQE